MNLKCVMCNNKLNPPKKKFCSTKCYNKFFYIKYNKNRKYYDINKSREYVNKNRKHINLIQNIRKQKVRKEIKQKILEIKNKSMCSRCGWNEYPQLLHFHHKDKQTKKFNIVTASFGCYSWKTIEDEIKKCILLCPNCHNLLHYNEHKNK